MKQKNKVVFCMLPEMVCICVVGWEWTGGYWARHPIKVNSVLFEESFFFFFFEGTILSPKVQFWSLQGTNDRGTRLYPLLRVQ